MKLQTEAKISKLLSDAITHEQLEQFLTREFVKEFKKQLLEYIKKEEDLILYGDSSIKEPLGILNFSKIPEKAILPKPEIPKLKPTEKAIPKKKIEKRG